MADLQKEMAFDIYQWADEQEGVSLTSAHLSSLATFLLRQGYRKAEDHAGPRDPSPPIDPIQSILELLRKYGPK